MTNHALALLLSLVIGISLGALGGGGSIVTLPILVYVAGIATGPAVGMSMAIVGSVSLLGSYLHSRRGNIALRTAVYFAAAGMVGAYVGSTGTHLISSSLLLFLFAMLMFLVGSIMLAGKQPESSREHSCSLPRGLIVGFGVGLLTGFLGVGGGFLIVPALVWFTGLDTKRAVGTSLAIIAANSAAGLLGQLRYTHWSWGLTAEFVGLSLMGMVVGVTIATRARDRSLRRAFAVMVLAVATAMVLQLLRRH